MNSTTERMSVHIDRCHCFNATGSGCMKEQVAGPTALAQLGGDKS